MRTDNEKPRIDCLGWYKSPVFARKADDLHREGAPGSGNIGSKRFLICFHLYCFDLARTLATPLPGRQNCATGRKCFLKTLCAEGRLEIYISEPEELSDCPAGYFEGSANEIIL